MLLDIGINVQDIIYHNINIDEAKLANELTQDGIHKSLESCRSVFQPKRKTQEFILGSFGDKRSLSNAGLFHAYLPVATPQIQCTKNCSSVKRSKDVTHLRHRKAIKGGILVFRAL